MHSRAVSDTRVMEERKEGIFALDQATVTCFLDSFRDSKERRMPFKRFRWGLSSVQSEGVWISCPQCSRAASG